MKRDKIYEMVQVAVSDDIVRSSMTDVPAAPNVDYWLVGVKSAAAEMNHLLYDYPPEKSQADWGAILATCVLCMMQNGVVRRGMGPVGERITVRGPATLKDVVVAINGERDYQDAQPHTAYGYSIMLDTYLRRAIDAWTNTTGDYDSLDEIRKLAGICVHCLEDCYAE
jgi:hypothetical protein